MGTSPLVLEAKNITKIYSSGSKTETRVLENVCLAVGRGEIFSVVGASGSGKTTLLQICGLLDKVTGGELFIDGVAINDLNDRASTKFRGENIGFIYQMHHLFPEFTALENVMLPLLAKNIAKPVASEKAKNLLEQLNLLSRAEYRPAELSGGERQRVAIARAMVTNPLLLLADEPTGNLDEDNTATVVDILFAMVKSSNSTMLLVTHSMDIARRADRVLLLKDRGLKEL